MLRANLCKISYIPVFGIYAVLPIIHDVLPYHKDYRSEDWLALAGMYALGMLISLPLFFLLKKGDQSVYRGSCSSVVRRAMLSTFLQLSCLYFFWENSVYLYLSISVAMGISAALFGIRRKGLNLMKDKDTGNLYEVRGNKAYKLTDAEASGYQAGIFGKGISLAEFSSSQFSVLDTNSSVLPVMGLSNTDFNQSIAINPSSGMPMVGGISGLDTHGNSWGTNFNEPSNTYDPNRGY